MQFIYATIQYARTQIEQCLNLILFEHVCDAIIGHFNIRKNSVCDVNDEIK